MDLKEAAVVDVETTGLTPETDRIVAVSALVIDFEAAARTQEMSARTFDALVNPGVAIPKDASRVHGISDADVADKESFADIAGQLRDFIGKRPLVGHNVQFDKRFLNAELKRAGHRMLTKKRGYCTQARFREHMETLYDKRKRYWKLDDLLDELGIAGRAGTNHEAAEDALLTAKAGVLFYSLDNGFLQRSETTARSKAPVQRDQRLPASSRGGVVKSDATSVREPPGPPKDRPAPRSGISITVWLVVIGVVTAIALVMLG